MCHENSELANVEVIILDKTKCQELIRYEKIEFLITLLFFSKFGGFTQLHQKFSEIRQSEK